MTFIEYYKSLPNFETKRDFRNEIINECKIQHSTFYTWLHRKIVPPLAQKVISEILKTETKILFPKSNLQNQ